LFSTFLLLLFSVLRLIFYLLTDQNKEINKSLMQANKKTAKLEQQLQKFKVKYFIGKVFIICSAEKFLDLSSLIQFVPDFHVSFSFYFNRRKCKV